MGDKNFITLPEAATMLKMHRVTLRKIIFEYEFIQSKNINDLTEENKKFRCPPYGRIGKKIVFSKEKLQKYIEGL